MLSVGAMDIKWKMNGKKWKRYGNQQICGGISKSRFDLLGNTNISHVKRSTKTSNGNGDRVPMFEKQLTS